MRSSNNDTFYKTPVGKCQCISGTEKFLDARRLLKNDDDDYSQPFGQTREVFGTLTKDDIPKPCISLDNFRSSNIRVDDVGYNLFVFDMRCQQNFTVFQPIQVELKNVGVVPNGTNGYALVLTNKLLSISSDSQRIFDLI